MALYVTSKSQVAEHPVFLSILENMPGGALVKVDARVPSGLHTLYAGTPIATNATSGEYMFMKSALVATAKANAATRIVVEAPHPFKVGEYVGFDDRLGLCRLPSGSEGLPVPPTVIADIDLPATVLSFSYCHDFPSFSDT